MVLTEFKKYDICSFISEDSDRYEVIDTIDRCRLKGHVLLASMTTDTEIFAKPSDLIKHHVDSIYHKMDLEADGVIL